MQLTFEYTMTVGTGSSPQAIHSKDNLLRIIYIANDNTVHGLYADPVLGLYDDLTFSEKGRISPDDNVSLPSIKKVAHYGAYGFWSAEGDHRFVVYMMPTDISRSLVDGNVQYSMNSEVSSLSCNLVNIRGELLNRYRALVTPGTKLEVYFSIGSTDEVPLGTFYIDRANTSYPEGALSVSARNAIGKLLKEQTFDENTTWEEGSLHDNLEAIMDMAEVEQYFIGDSGTNPELVFEPDTTVLDGIKYAISLLRGWKIAETSAGVVGIAPENDARFEPVGVYSFLRDRTCWSYSIEYDDADAASRVCVYSKGKEETDEDVRVYVNVSFNKWWEQPQHRTLHVTTIDGATQQQCTAIANELSASLAASGRKETFAGLFTPQLALGDEVQITGDDGKVDVIGSITDVTHNFGKNGFFTNFTVDSGGRKGRTRLKELIDTASSNPDAFTGVRPTIQNGDEVSY